MTVFGYQVLAGVDYALSPRTSMGVTARVQPTLGRTAVQTLHHRGLAAGA